MITKAPDRFNRFEVKYLVGAAHLPALLAELALYTRRDPNMKDPQGYQVHSVVLGLSRFRAVLGEGRGTGDPPQAAVPQLR